MGDIPPISHCRRMKATRALIQTYPGSKQPLPVENPGEAPAGVDRAQDLTVALGKPYIPSGPVFHLQNKGVWTR